MSDTVTKRELFQRVSHETDVPVATVRRVVQQFMDDLIDELSRGRRIEFRDFGIFEVVSRRPRVARNPRTGEAVEVPARAVVHFRQGKVMKERVSPLGGQSAPGTSLPGQKGEEVALP